jgi:hypothetical protein
VTAVTRLKRLQKYLGLQRSSHPALREFDAYRLTHIDRRAGFKAPVSKGPFMHDFLLGLAFVLMVVCPAISASIQIKRPRD